MSTIKSPWPFTQVPKSAMDLYSQIDTTPSFWKSEEITTAEKQTAEYLTFHMLDKLLTNDMEKIFFVKKEIAQLSTEKTISNEQVIYKECLEQYLDNLKD